MRLNKSVMMYITNTFHTHTTCVCVCVCVCVYVCVSAFLSIPAGTGVLLGNRILAGVDKL